MAKYLPDHEIRKILGAVVRDSDPELLNAIRGRLQGVPMAIFTESPNDVGDDDLAIVSAADLKRLPYVMRRETRLRDTEILLRRSERRHRDLIDNAYEALWIIDANARTTFANRKMAMILGTSVPELIGASFFDFIDEEWHAVARESLERRRKGLSDTYDIHLRRKDGGMVYATGVEEGLA